MGIAHLRSWLGLAGAAVLAVAASQFAACGDGSTPANAAESAPSLLFVQTTSAGTWEANGDGSYALTLTKPGPHLTVFTDRPDRAASSMTTESFVARWPSFGFTGVPPNAALVVNDAPADRNTAVVELTDPVATGGEVRYTARIAGDLGGAFDTYESDGDVPAVFGSAALFIDNAAASSAFQQVMLTITGVQPGQAINVNVSGNGANVAWSMGPSFESSAGISLTSASGAQLPVEKFSVNGSQIQILTSSAGGSGGALTISVEVFLVADPTIATFFLDTESGPGTQVTAAIGNTAPQVVNLSNTLFNWNPA